MELLSARNQAPRDAELRGLALGSAAVVIFSLTLPATRAAVPELGAIFVGLGRILVAAAIAAITLLGAQTRLPTRLEMRGLLIVGAGVVLGFPLLTSMAMRDASAASGAIVVGLLPLATAVFGARRNRERPSAGFWACAAAGSVLVVTFALRQGAGLPPHAGAALLAAVLCAAIGYAEGGRLARTLGGWQTIAWALVVSAPAALAAWVVAPPHLEFGGASVRAWTGFVYVAVFSQFLGFIPWYRGLSLGGVARVSQLQLLQVFLTLGFSAFLLGEAVSPEMTVFAGGVALCVWFGRKMPIAKHQRGKVHGGS